MKTPWRPLVVIALAAALLLTGCGSDDDPPDGSTDPRIAPGTYVVTATVDGAPHGFVKGTQVRFTFTGDQLGISAGCNSMGAGFTLDGDTLTADGFASTEMACDQPLMDQDSWIAGLFAGPVTVSAGDHPTITSGDVVLTLVPREEVSPDRPLAGTWWLLDSIIETETVSSVPRGVKAYFRIENGDLSGYDGCNWIGGKVRVTEDTLRSAGGLTTTLIGCSGDRQEISTSVAELLRSGASFSIEEERLILSSGENGLGFHAVAKEPEVG